MRGVRTAFAGACLLGLLACGGTYADDPANFNRIFQTSTPVGTVVMHSWYWRSPHWTMEYEAYIEFTTTQSFIDGLKTANELVRAEPTENSHWVGLQNRPQWFLTGPMSDYEEWLPANTKPHDGLCLYRRKGDGHWFFFDQQL